VYLIAMEPFHVILEKSSVVVGVERCIERCPALLVLDK
jgi:hypothetical protein